MFPIDSLDFLCTKIQLPALTETAPSTTKTKFL